jgi:hypothetical protein
MSVNVIKAEKVVRTALGLLERELVLPRLVWRDAGGSFVGAKGDAITIRLPSYAVARKRGLRSGAARVVDDLHERSVTVELTDNIYKRVQISDEELTLDIEEFASQVLAPNLSAIVRQLEDEVVDEIAEAVYPAAHVLPLDADEPYNTIVDARNRLNKARVPMSMRTLAVGADVESVVLKSEQFVRADASGSTDALREAQIGRIAGMPVINVPSLAPAEAYAFHSTAYVLSTQAPVVPNGAPWGASLSWEDFALRVVQALDPDEVVDNVHFDVFAGTNHVQDHGSFDDDGLWVPSVEPDLENGTDLQFVRAVKIEIGS